MKQRENFGLNLVKRNTKGIEPHQFKRGETGNKGGRPKEVLTQTKVKNIIGKLAAMTEKELLGIVTDDNATWETKTIAKHMLAAGDDISTLNFLFDRSIGKVKEQKEITVVPKPTIVERIDGSKMILGAELQRLEAPSVEDGEIEE